jgi:hypothetical protein
MINLMMARKGLLMALFVAFAIPKSFGWDPQTHPYAVGLMAGATVVDRKPTLLRQHTATKP